VAETIPSKAINTLQTPPSDHKQKIGFWVGLIISLVCLIASLWGINFNQTVQILSAINGWYVFFAVLSVVLTLAAKTRRWQVLLETIKSHEYLRLFKILNIGVFVNSFLPARLGDVYRVLLAGELEDHKKSYLLGTILIEKMSDLAGLLVTIFVLLFFIPMPAWLLAPVRISLIVTTILFGFIIFFGLKKDWLIVFLEKLTLKFKLSWINIQVRNGLKSFSNITHKSTFLKLFFWVGLITTMEAATNLLIFRSMNINLGIGAAFFVLVVLMIGISVPSSPGKFGVFHYLTVLALSVFDVPKEIAFSYGTLLHLVVYLPNVVLGGLFLWQEKISRDLISKTFIKLSTLRK
jgi:uncharacterized protein (TIRG00374 family)